MIPLSALFFVLSDRLKCKLQALLWSKSTRFSGGGGWQYTTKGTNIFISHLTLIVSNSISPKQMRI